MDIIIHLGGRDLTKMQWTHIRIILIIVGIISIAIVLFNLWDELRFADCGTHELYF